MANYIALSVLQCLLGECCTVVEEVHHADLHLLHSFLLHHHQRAQIHENGPIGRYFLMENVTIISWCTSSCFGGSSSD